MDEFTYPFHGQTITVTHCVWEEPSVARGRPHGGTAGFRPSYHL